MDIVNAFLNSAEVIDTDNDSVFMDETLQSYCREQQLHWTRSRAYRKNDQAWVSRKTARWSVG